MGRYDPLRDHLAACTEDSELSMTFDEIEGLVGPLPPAARAGRAWWANTADARVEALAWRSAGWRVRSVDQGSSQVVFARDTASILAGDLRAARPRSPGLAPVSRSPRKRAGRPAQEASGAGSGARGRARRRVLITDVSAAVISISAAAISQVAGLTDLPVLALALAAAAVAGIAAAVTQAVASRDRPATARRWWSVSTVLLLAAIVGAYGYHKLLDPSNRIPRKYELVVNGTEFDVIPLYGEAGGAAQSLATGVTGQDGLVGGQGYSFDCWTIGSDGAEWLRYERFGQTWWAPPFGESQPLVPHC
jgi:hypothetical protein